MDIVQFGMKSTLIQFRGCYFVYKGAAKDRDLSYEDVALAIGAYKSVFLADIVASYIFEETDECFRKCVFRGIYRDDGLVVFVGQQSKSEIQECLQKYQSLVNKLAGGNYLQFATKLWQPPSANKYNSPVRMDKKEKGVTVIHEQEFPFLCMKMGWDKESGEIRCSVFRKPNQAFKHVNRISMHGPTTFKSIASAVFTKLERLTLNISANRKAQIDKIYPDHAKVLFTADLVPPTDFPIFQELWQDNEKQKI
eukprot:3013057-Ditylum_brightwellii.AAC.1